MSANQLIITSDHALDLNNLIKSRIADEADFAKRLAIVVGVLEELFAEKNPEYAALLLENLRKKKRKIKYLKRFKKLKKRKK